MIDGVVADVDRVLSCAEPPSLRMSDPDLSPHLDPNAWPGLIDRMNLPVILAAIASWMGERIKQEMTAEDIWQEALAMAWRDRHRHEWRDLRSFRAWLLTIARNRLLDMVDRVGTRKRGSGRAPRLFSALGAGSDDSVSPHLPRRSTTPSRVASEMEHARVIEQTLQSLPARFREIVRLRLFEELPMREVAARLGIKRTTANSLFFQGASLYHARLEERLAKGRTR